MAGPYWSVQQATAIVFQSMEPEVPKPVTNASMLVSPTRPRHTWAKQ